MKIYKGDSLESAQTFTQLDEAGQEKLDKDQQPIEVRLAPYLPDQGIKKAVELMQILKRPLLIKGDPGCGKTRLAEAVAFEFYGATYKEYYFEWHIKSTTSAKSGLYTFDHINRLRNTQLQALSQLQKQAEQEGNTNEELSKEDLFQYLKLRPLGKAFAKSTADKPAILLIDEIDKADIDFPNDLLLELDQSRYEIEEIPGEERKASYPPLIFITSNDEKELPSAFLRRCLFHHIKFPDDALLKRIAQQNYPYLDMEIIGIAVAKFMHLRDRMERESHHSKHMDSTSELIDWLRVIYYYYLDTVLAKLESQKKKSAELKKVIKQLKQSKEIPEQGLLEKEIQEMQKFLRKEAKAEIDGVKAEFDQAELPHHQVLLKSLTDYTRFLTEESDT